MSLDVAYSDPGGTGYHPVLYMVRMAARLLGGRLVNVERRALTKVEKVAAALPRRRRGDTCLFICPSPKHLLSLHAVENWRWRYGRLVAWVFDSFWPEHIPRQTRLGKHFDQVFVTEVEDIAAWRRAMSVPVEWLPWGTDALGLGSASAERPLDLLRIGRQPVTWDDDEENARACAAGGLAFTGRPPGSDDADENERLLMEHFSRTKFTLSFSNTVSPALYTHRTRQYITARWTDALAAGATVAGVPPRGESVSSLLWEEALLDLGTVERAPGVEVVARAARDWSPERARVNHQRALERLDWRWRLKRLAAALEVKAPKLDAELAELEARVAAGRR